MAKVLAGRSDMLTWSLYEELLLDVKSTDLASVEYCRPCRTAVQIALVDVLNPGV
jgi:hypothetical protein